MKALSIRQPWAHLITMGLPILDSVLHGDGETTHVEWNGKLAFKDIENRSWSLPEWFKVPQRIYVHAGKREDGEALEWLLSKGVPLMTAMLSFSKRLSRGAIIGEVDIVGCVTESKSPWFVGPYGFVLANSVFYEKSIPCKGRLGFFEPQIEEMVR